VKKLVFIATLGLLILFAAGSAAAQSSGILRAHIPFQFLAGDSVLPAGTYLVRYDPAFRRVELVSRGGLTWARFERQVARHNAATANGLLLFNKYGTAYALREIWRPGRTGASNSTARTPSARWRRATRPRKSLLSGR
jgi:hypothetical protein